MSFSKTVRPLMEPSTRPTHLCAVFASSVYESMKIVAISDVVYLVARAHGYGDEMEAGDVERTSSPHTSKLNRFRRQCDYRSTTRSIICHDLPFQYCVVYC